MEKKRRDGDKEDKELQESMYILPLQLRVRIIGQASARDDGV